MNVCGSCAGNITHNELYMQTYNFRKGPGNYIYKTLVKKLKRKNIYDKNHKKTLKIL